MVKNRVNRDAKSLFAKLLATEDIAVRNDPSASTASFNVDTRVLVLPVLPDMDNDIYDLFVGHEVGHALFTPSLSEEEMLDVLKSVHENLDLAKAALNIVEDARIERLMRNKYPGLGRSFVKGYGKLFGSGFFGDDIDDTIDTLPILDRINLFYKLRINGLINVDPTDTEDAFIDRIDAASSFEDVIAIAKDLVQAAENETQEMQQEMEDAYVLTEGSQGEGGISVNVEFSPAAPSNGNDPNVSSEGDEQSDSNKTGNGSSKTGSGGQSSAIRDISDVVKHFKTNEPSNETHFIYNTLPTPNLSKIVVPWKKIHTDISEWWTNSNGNHKVTFCGYNHPRRNEVFDVEEIYSDFMSRNRSASSSMSQSFYRRMAAFTSRHTNVSKTGRLNMDIIHTYKYNDDLFLNATFVPKGKNHGMILYMDWSGSMSVDFVRTIEQLLNLVIFCRAIKIPFEVYGFSSVPQDFNNTSDYWKYDGNEAVHGRNVDKKGTPMVYLNPVHLLNILSSQMNQKEFVTACKNLLALSYSLAHETNVSAPSSLNLGGTPMEEAIIAGIEVAKKFRNAHRVQILNTIVLSDGESSGLHCWSEKSIPYYARKEQIVEYNGLNYTIRNGYENYSLPSILEMYRDATRSRMIGFYLVPSRYANRVLSSVQMTNLGMCEDTKAMTMDIEEKMKVLRKNKFVEIPYVGYHRYYLMDPSLVGMSIEDVFDGIDSSGDTKKIVREFVKNSGSRSKTRTLLNSFAELVAQEI